MINLLISFCARLSLACLAQNNRNKYCKLEINVAKQKLVLQTITLKKLTILVRDIILILYL